MSESDEGVEQGMGNGERIWKIDEKLLERSQMGTEEQGGGRGGINSDCGLVPSRGRGGIGR